ncbi:hypothetical protein [Cyclobacterium qasimii]|uniref:hypothetical protein n=1 Tax=Cyclobacterium qasimii TaxID=1350429 RepID=UPI001376CFEC|nr:hypothetical protein [Cyclobacterium qasimii]
MTTIIGAVKPIVSIAQNHRYIWCFIFQKHLTPNIDNMLQVPIALTVNLLDVGTNTLLL